MFRGLRIVDVPAAIRWELTSRVALSLSLAERGREGGAVVVRTLQKERLGLREVSTRLDRAVF